MTREEIEQAFLDAGWQLDGGFAKHLIIGYDNDRLSILAHNRAWETDDPFFELCDHREEEDITYWVREIPAPQWAAQLLTEYGVLPEEERVNPYKGARGCVSF